MLTYENVKKGPYVYSEIAADDDKNWCVKPYEGLIGESWYICVLADMAKGENPQITEAEFQNFCNDKDQDMGLIG
jgi:hypothetical protein